MQLTIGKDSVTQLRHPPYGRSPFAVDHLQFTIFRTFMRYPVAIELGDEGQAFGVVVPDLPGCFSAGDDLDEAMSNTEAAILTWIDAMLDMGQSIPQPSSVAALRVEHPELVDWVWALVTVDPARLDERIERIDITLPRRVLARLDAAAHSVGETRSGYIARLALS